VEFLKVDYIMKLIHRLSHIGDVLAIPFFALLVVYFYKIEDKNTMEYVLYYFSIVGLIVDTIFTTFLKSGAKI